MNRVIKFRAWDKKVKVMVLLDEMWLCVEYSSLAFSSSQDEYQGICAWPAEAYNSEKEDQIFMQFTGLTDKNGREIYEGDVVRVKAHSDWYEPIKTKGYADIKVEWYEKSAGFWPFIHDDCALGMKKYYMSNDDVIDCEVIGNVYENPELLTK